MGMGEDILFQRGDDVMSLNKDWRMVACDVPVKRVADMKEPYKNDWPDEDGDEEWTSEPHYEAYEWELTLAARSVWLNLTTAEIRNFVSWLTAGEFMIWSEHGNIGRQHVRYAGYSDDASMLKRRILLGGVDRDEWVVTFKVRLKVNDPVTVVMPNSERTSLSAS